MKIIVKEETGENRSFTSIKKNSKKIRLLGGFLVGRMKYFMMNKF